MTSQPAATLRSRYVEQAASDLQDNRRRQQELAESLRVLKQEEALLLDILTLAERYGSASDPVQPPARAEGDTVPAPREPGSREAAPHEPAAAPPTPAPREPAAVKATGKAKPAAKAEAGAKADAGARPKAKAKAKAPQPLLGDLLTQLLDGYDEPRHAKELREELLDKHPDRSPTPQVVRNTLESLVAKGRIRRHKQRRSVLYSLV